MYSRSIFTGATVALLGAATGVGAGFFFGVPQEINNRVLKSTSRHFNWRLLDLKLVMVLFFEYVDLPHSATSETSLK